MIPTQAAAPSARSTLADQRTASRIILVAVAVLVRSGLDGLPILTVILPVTSIALSLFAMWLSRVNYTERDGKDITWRRHPRSMFVCAAAAILTSVAGLILAVDLN
jgi:ABC-type Fe3+ transport system permease subunit